MGTNSDRACGSEPCRLDQQPLPSGHSPGVQEGTRSQLLVETPRRGAEGAPLQEPSTSVWCGNPVSWHGPPSCVLGNTLNQNKSPPPLSQCAQQEVAEFRLHLMLITLIVNPLFIDLAYNHPRLALN